jgi:hypothetical protein
LPTTLPWARGLILTVGFVAYANSLGNGFAYDLLARAIALTPGHALAYRRLAETRLLRGDGRAAREIALEGLKRVRVSAPLWGLVSESCVAKGDLEAAVRAHRAAAFGDARETKR